MKSSPNHPGRIRLGLCCQFSQAPIKFRITTATALARLARPDQLIRLAELCLHNADSLLAALQFCSAHGTGAFRIQSQILPVKTHPDAGYRIEELPKANDIVMRFQRCGTFAKEKNIRTGFHPDLENDDKTFAPADFLPLCRAEGIPLVHRRS